ncbi:MAG: hypothetical protein EOR84_14665 [Mesorhizobium sp.]|uniref:calcium-binding protein n=1 Tax=Mesorhizobium sp. TaxID=1871066 RepID=UPI000FE518CB|nr:calcium-binding protein [Mesorhizobium sp.]RWM95807.1 MAG: hypothetical protein EOR84_14665 [Mesorhizobium sp.]
MGVTVENSNQTSSKISDLSAAFGIGVDAAHAFYSGLQNTPAQAKALLSITGAVGLPFTGLASAVVGYSQSGVPGTAKAIGGWAIGYAVSETVFSWTAAPAGVAAGPLGVAGSALLSIAAGVGAGIVGQPFVDALVDAMVEWSKNNPAYPAYPWTYSPDSFLDPTALNPYSKLDPELGKSVRSGYTGLNTGLDTPSERRQPNTERSGSEFGGSSQAGGSSPSGGSNTGPTSSPSSGPSQAPGDSRAPDRSSTPANAGSRPARDISTPSTAPTPSARPGVSGGFYTDAPAPADANKDGIVTNKETLDHLNSLPAKTYFDIDTTVTGSVTYGAPKVGGSLGGGGGSSAGSTGSGSIGNPGVGPASSAGGSNQHVGDHGTAGNGTSKPVLLDLSGDGFSIDTLSSSSQFLDLDGDGYQHRTAWAGNGTGVLVLDADGDGKISRSSEFAFTEWDQTATGDLDALKSVFDTNNNGQLDAGDDRWSEFKVMVDGQLVSLASLGIASIGLTPTGSGQNFTDGSAITGTTQFTRTDGTTGAVGDAVLVSDENGYVIKSTTVTNGDGSKTTDLAGYGKDGTLAFQNRITVSADGFSTTTQFDDDGNGTYERSQSDVTTITAGVRQRVVSDFNTDGSLADRTTTTTSADKTTVTTRLDQDGDGASDQTQVFVKNLDGSTTTTVSEHSVNATLLQKIATTASANGLSKTVQIDSTGNGVYDLTSTETTVVAGDGTRTKAVANTSSGGTLIAKEQTVTSADASTRTVSHDLDGNGTYETRDVTAITNGANGVSVTTVSSYSSTNALIGRSVGTTSDDGLAKTASTDLDGDGLFDVISSDVTVVGAGGSLTETNQLKSRDGSLLGSSTTNTSADRKTISISTDADGDGHTDSVKAIVVDGSGVTTTTVSLFNPDGSLVGKTLDQTSANGLSLTSKADLNSDDVYDVIVTDVTTTDASSNRTRTVTTTSSSGALIGSTAITTSADSLTQTIKDDINADGTFDRTTVQATVLGGDGSRTVTTTATSTSGAMLARTEVKTSADRKTTTTKIDANGDTKTDRTQIDVINSDGSRVITVSDTDINGTLHAKSEATLSANGLTKTDKQDVNGDGVYDAITQAVTVIAASGVRTTTTSQTSNNGTLLSRSIAAVSANGLSVNTQFDADGDGTVEAKSSDATALNADGSTTRTVSVLAGTGALVGKTIATTSANGLTSTVQADLDGNGTIDRTTTAITVLAADGSKTDTVTAENGNNTQIARLQTIASGDNHTITRTNDIDGNGTIDETVTAVLNANGSTTETARTYGAGGVLTSTATHSVSANGLSATLATDLDGNGTIDQSTTKVIVLNADGSKTETITDLDGAGAVKDKTTIFTSANGLTKTATWAAVGTTTSRSMTDTTVLNANGSTTETVAYRKSNGALESQTVTTVSADKLTSTVTKDFDGDGRVDITTTSVKNPDGSVTSTMSGPNSENWSNVSTTTKATTVSADGLHSVTVYGPTSIKRMPTMTAKTTSDTSLGVDGSTVSIVKNYQLTTTATPTLFLADQTRITKGGDGFSTTKEWDMNGDGSYDSKETDVTVLNANGSTVRTVSKFEGAVLKSTFVTTTSANGLSITTNWDVFGADPFSQDTTDVTTINADGSSTRTVTNLKADGSQLSKFVTTTSADGRTTTTQEDIDGVVGFDRTTSDNVLTLADGATVETIKRSSTGGAPIDSATVTTSGDKRTISIARDADGDGTVDQTEVTTKLVDGSVKTVITDFNAANNKSAQVTITTSADGLSTISAWDFDGNGSVDQTRTATKAYLGDGSIEADARDKDFSGAFVGAWETVTSDDSRSIYTGTDIDNGGVDNIRAAIVAADGSVTESFHNGYHNVAMLIPGEVYWKNDVAENAIVKTSADGLTTTTYFDFDGNATNPTSNPTSNPSTTNFEVTAISQAQIDGSVVTTFTEKNSSGVVVAKGTMTTSADELTTTLLKDADNNGTYEHVETAVTRIDGSIRKVVTDYDASGVVTQTVTTDVSADGKSTSVVTANATTGTGTTTGVGVEFIAAGTTNDTITGSAGADHIQGGSGVDTINGGTGYDVIDGGTGADTLRGNTGNDTYIVDDVGDQVVEAASEGTDTVLSSVTYTISDADVENLTLTGAAAINATGNSSNNVLTGNSAANSISGGSGSDSLSGGAGDDSLTAGRDNDTLVGGSGNDYLNGQENADVYVFQRGDGSDTLEDIVSVATTASADINAAQALGVSASGTVNTWVGGYYWQTSTNSLLKLADGGSDSLALTGGITADNLSFAWAGVGQDSLVISITGGPAGDSITINQQALAAAKIEKLTLDGLGTVSFAVATAVGATLNGTLADEILFGDSGNETINGGGGNDIFYGGAGNDAIYGGSGADTVYGGTGNDNLNGAGGDDRYIFRRGDGTDSIKDFNIVTTSASADITAAQAMGVSATGIVNTWVGGYYWNTSTNGLQKATEGNVDTLALESGIRAEDLSFAWTGAGSDNLVINIGGGPAGDSVVLYQQKTAAARIEKLTLDGLGTRNFYVATAEGATVNGSADADIIFGLDSSSNYETLNGNAGNDALYSGAGDDVLNGGGGNDTLLGGTGNDYTNGQDGDDTYVFRRGDGNDLIEDYVAVVASSAPDIAAAQALGVSASGTVDTWVGGYRWITNLNSLYKIVASGTDTLALTGGIKADDLSFSWSGVGQDNLVVYINNGSYWDTVSINQQSFDNAKIDKLALDGQVTRNFYVAKAAGATVNGSTDADIMFGLSSSETLNGNAGSDALYGGAGSDTLVGGTGNDSYHFAAGGGADTIVESGAYNDNDELDFGAGIDANELWFSQQGNNLVVSVLGTTDKVTINDWFAGPGNVVETIKSGDGKVLNHSDVATLVAAMAGFDPATSPTGSGIQPGDPLLGNPAQTGTIAAAMQSSWAAV